MTHLKRISRKLCCCLYQAEARKVLDDRKEAKVVGLQSSTESVDVLQNKYVLGMQSSLTGQESQGILLFH